MSARDHKRRVKEAPLIMELSPTLNRDGGMELPPIYGALKWSRDLRSSRDR